jgi:hypothetical protein
MVGCRLFLFKLKESPRFLAASGRSEEAVVNLGHIANVNGRQQRFGLEDVEDGPPPRLRERDLETSYSSIDVEETLVGQDDYSRLPTNEGEEDIDGRDGPSLTKADPSRRPAWISNLPPVFANHVADYLDRVALLFAPDWARTTTLVWIIWTLASLAYTSVEAFRPFCSSYRRPNLMLISTCWPHCFQKNIQ